MPSDSSLEIVASNNMLHDKVKEHFGLRFFETLDLSDELSVDEETLLPSDGVYPDEGMYRSDWILPNEAAHHLRVYNHLGRCVHCLEPVKERAQGGG